MTGGFAPGPFRTGASKGSNLEHILSSLNQGLGTSYAANDPNNTNTIAWVENMAIARAINDLWEANRRLACQWDPARMSVFIPRWEKILGIVPSVNASLEDRKKAIAFKFSLWTKPPTPNNVSDLVKQLIPNIFIDLEFHDPLENGGSVPGGLTIPGGVTLPDGPWTSDVNSVLVRVWQPRDHFDNLLMPTSDFVNQLGNFTGLLVNYLPTYVSFQAFRYVRQGPGTITIAAGSTSVVGSGTFFLTDGYVGLGDSFEGGDDNNHVQTYKIASITDDTHLTITTPATASNTNGTYRILGFILDSVANLDTEAFR